MLSWRARRAKRLELWLRRVPCLRIARGRLGAVCARTGERMSYAVKEIFYSLQGEGARTGRPAVFLRFSGCNLWSGREEDRSTAICKFCDTDFVGMNGQGGGRFDTAEELALAVAAKWPDKSPAYVVCTGGGAVPPAP